MTFHIRYVKGVAKRDTPCKGVTKRDTPWGVVTDDTPQKKLCFFFAYSKDFLYLCSVKKNP